MKIFVYGTLLKGEGNNSLIKNENSKFLGKSVTSRGFTLYDLGGFPGMVKGGTGSVVGEIYEVDSFTIARLDILEGHPQFYRRSIIELQTGEKVQAYILDQGYVRGCPIIKSGSWIDK
tara:strand:- start:1209 stop:1562 length:354 start_codon:yes stop_codon:yes gene_type:complete